MIHLNIKEMRIKYRLALGFGILILGFMIASIFSIIGMVKLSDYTSKLYKHPFTVTTTVLKIKTEMQSVRLLMRDVVLAQSPSELSRLRTEIEKTNQSIYQGFELINQRYTGDKLMVADALDKFESYSLVCKSVIQYVEKGDEASRSRATDMNQTKGRESILAATESITKLFNFASNKARVFNEEASSVRDITIIGMIIMFLLVLGLLVLFAMRILKSISAPIERAGHVTKLIAEGKLDVQFDVSGKDEISDLVRSLQDIVDKFKVVISSVILTSDKFASASVKVNATAQHIARGASQQASAVEEISSSMEEMVANIQQNTDNSQQTDKIATKSVSQIQIGSKAVSETLESMRAITEKVSVISEIAFQTNLLALNASVEAARAGEHGKGFAVVASEVRKLAAHSQTAAKEINSLSKKSMGIADRTGKLFVQIVPSIQHTANLIQEITVSSLEQNNGANQINMAIQQLSNVTQENAHASEELANNAEEMTRQAEKLQDIVAYFNVGEHPILQSMPLAPAQKKEPKPTPPPPIAASDYSKGIHLKMDDNTDEQFQRF